jgi:hypothetical protein
MRWISDYTIREKHKRKKKQLETWHKWFAWYPVVVGITKDNRKIKIWWEYVERKCFYSSGIIYSQKSNGIIFHLKNTFLYILISA